MPERSTASVKPHPFEALWFGNYMEPSAPLFRREWYEKAGPFELGIEGHSDYEFWLRLSAMGCQFRYLSGRLVFYRVHDKNYTHKTELMTISRLNARKKIIQKFPALVAEQADKIYPKVLDLTLELKERERQIKIQAGLISELEQKIARYQQDLQALQQTYTVRISRALGELFARIKK